MKSLYNEYNAAHCEEAYEIDKATSEFFRNLLDKYPDHNPREISHLVTAHIRCIEAECVLRAAMEKRKAEKNA